MNEKYIFLKQTFIICFKKDVYNSGLGKINNITEYSECVSKRHVPHQKYIGD